MKKYKMKDYRISLKHARKKRIKRILSFLKGRYL